MKFYKYYVTDGTTKARVRYSINVTVKGLHNCITIREKDYENNLSKIAAVRNDTDILTDYFENNSLTYLEGSKEYAELLPKIKEWEF